MFCERDLRDGQTHPPVIAQEAKPFVLTRLVVIRPGFITCIFFPPLFLINLAGHVRFPLQFGMSNDLQPQMRLGREPHCRFGSLDIHNYTGCSNATPCTVAQCLNWTSFFSLKKKQQQKLICIKHVLVSQEKKSFRSSLTTICSLNSSRQSNTLRMIYMLVKSCCKVLKKHLFFFYR